MSLALEGGLGIIHRQNPAESITLAEFAQVLLGRHLLKTLEETQRTLHAGDLKPDVIDVATMVPRAHHAFRKYLCGHPQPCLL